MVVNVELADVQLLVEVYMLRVTLFSDFQSSSKCTASDPPMKFNVSGWNPKRQPNNLRDTNIFNYKLYIFNHILK